MKKKRSLTLWFGWLIVLIIWIKFFILIFNNSIISAILAIISVTLLIAFVDYHNKEK